MIKLLILILLGLLIGGFTQCFIHVCVKTETEPVECPLGDYTGDCCVDDTDTKTLLENYGTVNSEFDLDGDGKITIFDAVVVTYKYGEGEYCPL